MGCVCCCFRVEDPEDGVNSSNNTETCKCPHCFLQRCCIYKSIKRAIIQWSRKKAGILAYPEGKDSSENIQPREYRFAAITFNKDEPPGNQNNGISNTPRKDNFQEHANAESTGCCLGFSSRKLKSDVAYVYETSEEEEVCPTCLEEYTPENPKIVTKCSHHYHLSCIYEWMERSSICPVCSKVMIFDETT